MVVFVVDGGELVEAEILLPTKLSSSDDPNTPEVTPIGNSIADGWLIKRQEWWTLYITDQHWLAGLQDDDIENHFFSPIIVTAKEDQNL